MSMGRGLWALFGLSGFLLPAIRAELHRGVLPSPAYEAPHLVLRADEQAGRVLVLAELQGNIPNRKLRQFNCPVQTWEWGERRNPAVEMGDCAGPGSVKRSWARHHDYENPGVYQIHVKLSAREGGYSLADGFVLVAVGD